ncbi:unnamed protein product [Caenorhabditis bovis]|uniref:Neuropeptide-Like Protein n=1 Tax=Caenorhabditis bovis TaxID=2654633 RepID=A0A8S1F4V2_9PELO|nr:unnamed protein product [Caenorhabditis bovis]
MLQITSLLCSIMILSICCSSLQASEAFGRQIKSFPYSVSFYRMLGHDRHLSPYYGVNDEVAALIDSMNTDENPSHQRYRRSDGLRGYACRFKFCRIYDN